MMALPVSTCVQLRCAPLPLQMPRFHDNLHHGGVELLLVAHGGGAAFHVTHVGAFIGHNERALELAGATGVDAEIAAQFHGAADAFGNVAEGTVGENGAVQGGKEIVAGGDNAGQVLLYQLRMLFYGLRERAKDNAFFCQGFAEGGGDGHGIKNGIYRHNARQHIPFLEGDAQFVKGFCQLGVYLLGPVFILFGCSIIDNVLEINLRHIQS